MFKRSKPLTKDQVRNPPSGKTVITCGGCMESFYSWADKQGCKCHDPSQDGWLPGRRTA